MTISILSTYSGAGGDSRGLINAGMSVTVAVDNDKDCCRTFRHNLRNSNVYQKNVEDISLVQKDFNGILTDLSSLRFNGISGGPPCQGSSRLNIRRKGIERNLLTLEVIRLAQESKADFFLIENVPTFALKEEVIHAGKKIGYHMHSTILNSGDFGVPQLRRRWFCLGLRTDKGFTFPSPTTPKPLTIRHILSQMKESWGYATRSPEIMKKLDALDDTPNKWISISNGKGKFPNAIAWDIDRPAPCLTHTEKLYQKLVGIPGTIPQSLSAIIQGFPNSWKFFGTKRSVAQQIVNACPPQLAQAIGTKIMETLNK